MFDAAGHLLAEHDGATADVIREYVWLGDMLVAAIDSSTGSAVTFFVHTGQLDEPLVMTDGSKGKVWDAYVEPYGLAQVFGPPAAGLALRLPGQWEELEAADLSQNWHRNYDPTLGRYIEADPLGIEAGQNLYGYVDGDPLNAVDPSGLLVTGTYNQSTGILTITDLDTGQTASASAFSGTNAAGEPRGDSIPNGLYDLLDYQSPNPNHRDWFRLDPRDEHPRDDIDQRRKGIGSPGSYRLHFGTVSLGCITVRSRSAYNQIAKLIAATKTTQTRDMAPKFSSNQIPFFGGNPYPYRFGPARNTPITSYGTVTVIGGPQ